MGDKARIEELDILKSVAILLVVIGHYYHPKVLAYMIWSFHMPLFVMLSGFFCKEVSEGELVYRIKKLFKSYMVPYLITISIVVIIKIFLLLAKIIIFHKETENILSILMSWLYGILYAQGNDLNINGQVIPNVGATWFLVALFMGQLTLLLVTKIWSKSYTLVVLVCNFLLLHYLSQHFSLPLQLYGGAIFSLWLFFGKCIKKYLGSKYLRKIMSISYLKIFIVALLWMLCVSFELKSNIPFDICNVESLLYGVGFLGAIFGTLFCYYIAILLKNNLNYYLKNKVLYLGKNTIWVLAIHSIDMICFTSIFQKVMENDLIMMIIRLVLDIIVSIIAKEVYLKMRWIFFDAKKAK